MTILMAHPQRRPGQKVARQVRLDLGMELDEAVHAALERVLRVTRRRGGKLRGTTQAQLEWLVGEAIRHGLRALFSDPETRKAVG